MELYSAMVSSLQADIACRLCIQQSELEEWQNVTRQGIAEHGIRYLTVVLPSIGKRIDRSLQGDTWFEYVPDIPVSLYTRVWSHLGFVHSGGKEPCAEAVSALRQFLYLLYKLELPFELVDELKVILEFVAVDKIYRKLTSGKTLSSEERAFLRRVSSIDSTRGKFFPLMVLEVCQRARRRRRKVNSNEFTRLFRRFIRLMSTSCTLKHMSLISWVGLELVKLWNTVLRK